MDNKKIEKLSSTFRTTFEMLLLYYFIGIMWIIFSDKVLRIFDISQRMLEQIEVYKGIFYVFVSGVFFYAIVKRRMDLYVYTIKDLKLTTSLLKESDKTKISLEQKLYDLAYFDELTGLPNKIYLEEQINLQIKNQPDVIFGLLYFDIDDFRNINELHGHDVGDELLVEVARILKGLESKYSITARHNSDEFLVALFFESKHRIKDILDNNLKRIRKSFLVNNDDFFITISGGVAFYPDDGKTFKDIFISADVAMAESKLSGKDSIIYFTEQMQIDSNRKIEIVNLLHHAIKQNEFMLHYQPIVKIETGEIVAVEALIRWFSKTKGYIPPLDFIPLAELSDNISEITKWVFVEAMNAQKSLDNLGYVLKMSINISARALMGHNFVSLMETLVLETKADPKRIELEITETAIITDIKESIRVLNLLKKMGFVISIDDFGTGYSSLSYLNKLPVDILKIDRTFINNITEVDTSPVVEFMVNIASQLKLDVIVEGVETIKQRDIVKEYGCKYAQGYLYSKPLSITDLIDYIKNEKKGQNN